MPNLRKTLRIVVCGLLTLEGLASYQRVQAQQNNVKGQNQLAGFIGKFGTTYSLKSGINLTILSAKYTIDPFECPDPLSPGVNEKIVLIDFAIKNATQAETFVSMDGKLSLVDARGQIYSGFQWTWKSVGKEGGSATLKPGQGLGQPALNDPLQAGFVVPANAVITKLMVNEGRLNTSEEVVRYQVVPPTKLAVASHANVIASLPDTVHDATDQTGAIARPTGRAAFGVDLPSGIDTLRLESVTSPEGVACGGRTAADGMRFVVCKVTAKQIVTAEGQMFYIQGGNDNPYKIVDADGESYHAIGFKKMSTDEDAERDLKKGDQYAFRVIFEVPKAAKLKTLTMGVLNGRLWDYDLASVSL